MSGNFRPRYGFRGGPRPLGQRPPSLFSPSAPRMGGPGMSSYVGVNSSSNFGGSRYGSSSNTQSYGPSNNQSYTASSTYSNYSAAANSGSRSSGSYSGAGGNYSGVGSSGGLSTGQLSGSGLGSNYNTSGSGTNFATSGSNYNTSGTNFPASGSNYNTSDTNFAASGSNYNTSGTNFPASGSNYNTSGTGTNYAASGSNYNTGGSGTNFAASGSSGRSTADTLTLSDFLGDKRGDKSWDNVKRKYGLGGGNADDHASKKKPRLSISGGESEPKDEKILMYLGNMPSNVTKEKIETMFEYIPGIVSYSLRRHKYNYSNACIIVEMTSREAAENLQKTFNWMEVNGRCIVCRFCNEGEEENFTPDPDIKSDNFVYKSVESVLGKKPVKNKKSVYVWNLPCTSGKADLENFVSDLNYKSIEFTEGDRITGETGHAYFDFDYDEDAQKMFSELQGSLYFGSCIKARFEYGKQGGDDYVPMPLGEAEDFISHGALSRDRPAGQVSTAPSLPKNQPSKQFEEYIKGHKNTPLIGLEYVTEYFTSTKNTPRYLCDLCAATPQGLSIVSHLISCKHRIKHMEKLDPDRYSRIIAMSQQKSFLTAEGLKYATEVEQREGRQLIKVEHNPKNVTHRLPVDLPEEGKPEPQLDQNSDLFSRLTAYKQKIKEIEGKQKEKQLSGNQNRTSQQPGQSGATKQTIAADLVSQTKSTLKQQLAAAKEPILGLDFLKSQPDPSNTLGVLFTCNLCGSLLRNTITITQHVTGLSHRLEYFKRRHHDLFLECGKIVNRSAMRKVSVSHAIELEKTDGRGTLWIDGEAITGDPRETIPSTFKSQSSSAAVSGSVLRQVDMEFSDEDEDTTEMAEAVLFDMLKDMDEVPLVGLRYVTETQSYNSYDPPKYKCSLCSVEVSKTFIITHLTGHQHRIAYIKENYPELLRDAEGDKDTLNNYCRDIEKDIGREHINVVKMVPPKDLNSPVTFSKPIKVKAPSADAPDLPEPEPEPEPEDDWKEAIPAPNVSIPKPEFLMSHQEKRALALQKKIQNRHNLPANQREELERQLKRDGKKADGTVVHFYDLIEEHENEPLLGLASCVEVWHPRDTEPPMFRCHICDHNTTFKQIVEHLISAQHKMKFFERKHPEIYRQLMSIRNDRQQRLGALRNKVKQFDQRHVQETIRYTVATDDTPWRTMKKNINLMLYMKHDSTHKVEKPLESVISEVVPQFISEETDDDDDLADDNVAFDNVGDESFQSQGSRADMATEEQGSSVADLIDHVVMNDEKWEEVSAEIKKRVSDGRILFKKDQAKFLKTYKPFLGKFPVIGLEWLSEFQKEDENANPWYLCRLCRSKIDWNDIVDHVVSMYHRMSFIQKEHPTLHELLKESIFESGEMNEKIEEFAKGIAKPPTEHILEVLVEKGTKQEYKSPKKDFSSMVSKRMGGGPRPLDLESGQGSQAADSRQGSEGALRSQSLEKMGGRKISEERRGPHTPEMRPGPSSIDARQRGQSLDNRGGRHISEERRGPRTPEMRPGPSGFDARQRPEPSDLTRGPKGSDIRGEPKFPERRPGQNMPGPAQKRPGSETLLVENSAAKKPKFELPKKVPGAIAKFSVLFGAKANGPLIGLEYLTEIQVIGSLKKPHYYCELCDCKLIPGSVLTHLYGMRHRQSFFDTHCPEILYVTEKIAEEYERKHGRGRVSVVRQTHQEQQQERVDAKFARMDARQAKKDLKAAKRRDHEMLEQLGQGRYQQPDFRRQQTPSPDIPEKHGLHNLSAEMGQNQPQSLFATSVTVTPKVSLTQPMQGNHQMQSRQNVEPNQLFASQQSVMFQQGPVISPSSQQNIPNQQQKMQLQQPRPSMLQQQPQMQQSQQLMQQQQPQMQQLQPVMQQRQPQMQQPQPLMQQSQMISQVAPGMNVQGQQQSRLLINQPQMISQMTPNMIQRSQQNIKMGMQNLGPQQNIQLGMPYMGPQQNIQMGMMTTNVAPTNQQMMMQQSPQVFQGISPRNPIDLTGPNNNQNMHPSNMVQQNSSQPVQRIPDGFNNQKRLVPQIDPQRRPQNVQRPKPNQTLNQSSMNKELQKQNQSEKADRTDSKMSNYRIPNKNSPRKENRQENYSDNRQIEKGRWDNIEKKTARDITQHRPPDSQSSIVANDNKKSEKYDSKTQGSRSSSSTKIDRFSSRTIDKQSRDTRDSSYRNDGSRISSSDSKHKDDNKHRSPDSRHRDDSKNKTFDRKQKDGSSTRSSYSNQKDENKKTIPGNKQSDDNKSNKDSKQRDESNKSKSSVKINQKDESKKTTLINKQSDNKSNKDSKQRDELNKSTVSSKKKETEEKQVQSKVYGKTKTTEKAAVSGNKSKLVENRKSGSYIEIEDAGARKTSKEKEETSDKTVIIIDLTPSDKNLKSKHVKPETQIDKTKQVKLVSSPANGKLNDQSTKAKTEEKPSEKTSKTSVKQLDIKEKNNVIAEPAKTNIKDTGKDKTAEGKSDVPDVDKLSCTVTVDLIDIATVSNNTIEEMKQNTDGNQSSLAKSSPRKGYHTQESGSVKDVSMSKTDIIKSEQLSKMKTGMSDRIEDKKSADENSPQKDKKTNFLSRSKEETKNQSETAKDQKKVTKQLESRPSFGHQSRKSYAESNNTAGRGTQNTDTVKPELKTAESNDDEQLDEWAVTDEWCDDEGMEVDAVENKEVANKKEVHSTVVFSKEKVPTSAGKKIKEQIPVVSVTVEIDEDKSQVVKPSSKDARAGKETFVSIDVIDEDTAVSKKDNRTEAEKKTNMVESMEIDINNKSIIVNEHIADPSNKEQSDNEEDFMDLSEFVTLDEEGEVDEIVVSSRKLTDTQFSRHGETDSKSERSRGNRSRSKDGSSLRSSGRSEYRSPRIDRSRSKDTCSRRSEHSGVYKSSRSSRSKGDHTKESASSGDGENKKFGSSQGQGTTRMKDGETDHTRGDKTQHSSQKGVTETKTTRKMSQSSNTKDQKGKISTSEEEKPASFVASSRALGKDFTSKAVPATDNSKKATQQAKPDVAKASKSSIEIGSGVKDNLETDKTTTGVEKGSGAGESKKEKDRTASGVEIGVGAGEFKKGKDKAASDGAKSNQCTVEIDFGDDGKEKSSGAKGETKSTDVSGSQQSVTKVGQNNKSGKPKCEVSISFD